MKHPLITLFAFALCLQTTFAYPFLVKGRITTGKDLQPCASCVVYMISDDNKYAVKNLTDKDGNYQLALEIADDITSIGMRVATYDPCTKAEATQTTKAAKGVSAIINLQVCNTGIVPPPAPITCYEPYFKYSPNDEANPQLKWTFYGFNQDKTTLKWNFGDGSPIITDITPTHVFPKEGEYKVTLTMKMDSCEKSHTEVITIIKRSICAAKFEYNFDTKNPLTTNFLDRSVNATKWDWYFGNEGRSTEQNPKFTFPKDGYYFVTQVIYGENGCISKYGTEILVEKVPPPDTTNTCAAKFDFKQDATNPLKIQFQDYSYNATGYRWDFGDGTTSSEKNPAHIFAKSGEYKVTLYIVAQKNCANVLSLPVFAGTHTADCYAKIYYTSESNNRLIINFQGFADKGKNWNWDFGDGATATEQNPTHVYAKAGIYKITLVAINDNCKASTTIEIQVGTPLPPAVTPIIVDKNCQALFAFVQDSLDIRKIIFKDMSTTQKGKITNWGWIFGDQTSAVFPEQNPVHIFTVAGVYEVRLKIATSEGCTSEYRMKVSVGEGIFYPKMCQALFIPYMKGLIVGFQNKSFSNSPTKDAYRTTWDFGDGTTSFDWQPIHEYKADGQYKVTLTFSHGGCTSSITVLLDVNRTKLTDESGSDAFEAVATKKITATHDEKITTFPLKIAPVPVQDMLNMEFIATKTENVTLSLFDVAGNRLQMEMVHINLGENRLRTSVSDLAHGLYLVQIKTETSTFVTKFVK